ncbi:unnamed protein product [Caenorhabditis angaria]|uniref:Uncharacterized protein n=1 Tax=Caenorhabditis angaria TaxID=860376 RepID=A0A9P1MXS1_9PELO|nr:unnamed protein product [Caenorhabditis angaria]
MGISSSCARKRSHTSIVSSRAKTIKISKNRKIKQRTGKLYKVIFDADGFSVHDLALINQKHSENPTIIDQNLKPQSKGTVKLLEDPEKVFRISKEDNNNIKQSSSDCELKIEEILDYVDDLYLQLLDPDRNLAIEGVAK